MLDNTQHASPKSNPQLEDRIPQGFTAIPNDLLEHLAQLYLRPNDWQVLLSIIRKTLGWHKETDFITNSQIMEATGLCKTVVSRSLPKLQKRNVIIRRKRQIGVQQDWTRWTLSEKQIRQKLAKQQTPDTKLANQQTSQKLAIPSTQLATQSTKVSYPRDTQKKTDTHQKKVKGAPLSEHQQELFEILKRCSAIKDSDAYKLPELLQDYPHVDHALEFKMFCEWWPGPKKRKKPWVTLRNWLERAQREAIQSPGGKRYGRLTETKQHPKFNVQVIKSGENENGL